jgi:hypothetical protein
MAKDIFEIEYNGEIFTVEADSDAEALALVTGQSQAPAAAATEEIEGLIPVPGEDGMSEEVAVTGGGGLAPGTAGMAGALLATGASKYTEPLRRGARAGLRSTAGFLADVGPKAPGVLGSAVGAGVGGSLGAVVGSPFVGATLGATTGGAAGHYLRAPLERATRVVEGGLDTKPLGTAMRPGVADAVADYAARPGLKDAARLASQSVEEKGLGLEAPARESARRASEARTAAARTSAGVYRNTTRARGIFDSIFGKAGAGGRLGPSKALPALGAALGAYELFNIGKGLYDRNAAGEDVPASEAAMAAGLGILGLLPGMSSAAKAGRTLATGGRRAIVAEAAAADKTRRAVTTANYPRGPQGGRSAGAGPATVKEEADELVQSIVGPRGGAPNNPVAQNLERERRAIERAFQGGGGGRAGGPSNLSRQSSTEAVASGQGPSGGARGVRVEGTRPLGNQPPNLETARSLDDLLEADKGAHHRMGEFMRERGVQVKGRRVVTNKRPKKQD